MSFDEHAIVARELGKRFKNGKAETEALAQLSLEVRPGGTYGLIGPDGAGKTTAVRLLLGLLRPTSGQSRILGFDSMRDTYRIREQVGYIAQQNVLPADLTVLENMRFFARVQCVEVEQQRQRIPELLDFAGLVSFTDRLAGRLSGGMKKKLALACCLVHAPKVVVLDEPTLGVDPVSRREFWGLLGDLRAAQGLTIFVCTPYMDEAERCTDIGLLYQGRMIASGSPQQIKEMVVGQLIEFAAAPLASAQDLCATLEGVLETQTYGEKLHVFVDDPVRRAGQIAAALAAHGIAHDEIRQIETRMEEAFISLVRRQAESEQPGRVS